jgi:hypothetical protein
MVVASLIDSLSKVGAITGIVSFVGVGLLLLLVASQSRQIRAMREWIDAEPERQAETSQRVIAEVQRRIAAARERRAAHAAGAPVPAAPVGAPRAAAPGAPADPRVLAAAASPEVTSAPATIGGSVPPPAIGGESPVFAPLTPAGDADGASIMDGMPGPADVAADALVDGTPVSPSLAGQATQAADPIAAEYDPLSAATPAAQAADPRFASEHFSLEDDFHEDERPRGNRVLFGVGAAAVIAGIALAATVLFGGGKDQPSTGGGTTAAKSTSDRAGSAGATDTDPAGDTSPSTPDAADPSLVRVVVLNGTTVNKLAQKVSDQLTTKGYSVGQPNTLSSNQTLASSVVEYRAGKSAQAQMVAKDLGIPAASVQAISADVSAAAPETANVVVVTGQDLATGASSDTSSGTPG